MKQTSTKKHATLKNRKLDNRWLAKEATIHLTLNSNTTHFEFGREELISLLLSCCTDDRCSYQRHNLTEAIRDGTRKIKIKRKLHQQPCESCIQIRKAQQYLSKSMLYFQIENPRRNNNIAISQQRVFVSGVNASKLYLNNRKILSQNSQHVPHTYTSFQDAAGITWKGGIPFQHRDMLTFVDTDKSRFRFRFHLHISDQNHNTVIDNIFKDSKKSKNYAISNRDSSSSHSALLTMHHFSHIQQISSKLSDSSLPDLSYPSVRKQSYNSSHLLHDDSDNHNDGQNQEACFISREQFESLQKALPSSSRFYNALVAITLEQYNTSSISSTFVTANMEQLQLPELLATSSHVIHLEK